MTNALNTPVSLLTVPQLLFVVAAVAFIYLLGAMVLELWAGCSRAESTLVMSVVALVGSVVLYHLVK